MANPSYRKHAGKVTHARIRHARRLKAFLVEQQVDLNGTGAASTFTTAGAVFTLTSHGLTRGTGPFFLTTTGTLPTGLSLNQQYWINSVVDANTISLATSISDPVNVLIAGSGSGTHTITKASDSPAMTRYLNQSGATLLKDATDVDNL